MDDGHPSEERPEYRPERRVAKALEQQWTRLCAVPASRMVGGLNMLFGVLAVLYCSHSIVRVIRLHNEFGSDPVFDMPHIAIDAIVEEGMAKDVADGMAENHREFRRDMEDMAERMEEERTEFRRDMLVITLKAIGISLIQLAIATFLAWTGLLLWRGTRRARKLARIALWLIPAGFLISCIVDWPPVMTDWSALVSGTYEWLFGRSWPARVVIASIGWLWVIVYPLLALRALRREADIEVHLQEASPA